MVGSIGPGQSFAAFAAPRAFANPGATNPVNASQNGTSQNGASQGGLAHSENSKAGPAGSSQELTEGEEKQVRELKKRDAEVRAHEQAHSRVGGSHAGGPSYTFQAGPDGKRYAVGGEVQIDTSPVAGNPEATISKLDVVIRAALAPADPSSQDLKVAAAAREGKLKAQAELRAQRQAELAEDGSQDTDATSQSEGNNAGETGNTGETAAVQGLLSLIKTQEAAQKDTDKTVSSLSRGKDDPAADRFKSDALDGIRAYQDRITGSDPSGSPQEQRPGVLTPITDRSDQFARVA